MTQKAGEKGKTIRSFVAIELPAPIQQALGQLQAQIRETGLSAKWSVPENIHLTLQFLGDVSPAAIAQIGESMAATAAGFFPMELYGQSVGVFPGVKRARVLWTGVGGDTEVLGRLQQDLADRLSQIGFEKEKRRFAGHFTLARFKDRVDPETVISVTRQFGDFVTQAFVVDAIHLFESRLTPKGPVYSKLKTCALAGGDG
ncbi:MAG: RNA 2',3'-cyclic phosphodiesterase [Thermodesulfobacteriota bacterium]